MFDPTELATTQLFQVTRPRKRSHPQDCDAGQQESSPGKRPCLSTAGPSCSPVSHRKGKAVKPAVHIQRSESIQTAPRKQYFSFLHAPQPGRTERFADLVPHECMEPAIREEIKKEYEAITALNLINPMTQDMPNPRVAEHESWLQDALCEFQKLVAKRSPDKDQCLAYMMNAEAVKLTRYPRCDDWCYLAISEWLQCRPGFEPLLLLKLITNNTSPEEVCTHFCLLIPSTAKGRLFKPGSKSRLLINKDGKPTKLMTGLAALRPLLYDPALGRLTTFDMEALLTHVDHYTERYRYENTLPLGVEIAPAIHTPERPYTQSELDGIRKETCNLLALALFQLLSHNREGEKLYRDYTKRLNGLGITPADARPDIFREGARWSLGALRCFLDVTSGLEEWSGLPRKPSDSDIVFCYRDDLPQYKDAVFRSLKDRLKQGVTLEACLNEFSKEGVISDNFHHKEAPVRIPSDLLVRSTNPGDNTDWNALDPQVFVELDIQQTGSSCCFASILEHLAENRESFLQSTGSDPIDDIKQLCLPRKHKGLYQYRQELLFDRPELKDDIRTGKACINHSVVKHALHQEREHLDKKFKFLCDKWQPMHSLRVCQADHPVYEGIMVTLLQEAIDQCIPPEETAKLLASGIVKEKNKQQQETYKVELPVHLIPRHKVWSKKAVEALIKELKKQKKLVDSGERKADALKSMLLEFNKLDCWYITSLSKHLFRRPGFMELVLQCYPQLNKKKVSKYKDSCTRFLISQCPELEPPEGHAKKLELKPYDEVRLLTPDSDEWRAQLLATVEHYLLAKYSLTYIARRLSNDLIYLVRVGIPVPGSKGESTDWSYQNLIDLLQSEDSGQPLTDRFSHNRALALELALYQRDEGSISEFDGQLILQMYNPELKSPPLTRRKDICTRVRDGVLTAPQHLLPIKPKKVEDYMNKIEEMVPMPMEQT